MDVKNRLFARGGAIALAAFLLVGGAAFADTSSVGIDATGALNQARTTATLTGNVVCTVAPGALSESATLTVHIYQSVGRLINIGIGDAIGPNKDGSITCDGTAQTWSAVVNAIPGLTFQPGPATVVVRSVTTETVAVLDPVTGLPTGATTTQSDADQEFGGVVNLRPFHK